MLLHFRWLKGWLIWEPVWKSDAVGLIWLLYIMLHISMCRQFLRLFWKLVKYVVCKIKISKKVKLLQKISWKIITFFWHTKNKICQNKKNMQFDEKMKINYFLFFFFSRVLMLILPAQNMKMVPHYILLLLT